MPVPDPVAITIFGIDIMWYAIFVCLGMVLATVMCCLRAPIYGLDSDTILNFLVICIPAAIIGARLYYVLFHFDWYASDPLSILNLRAGGLAIHGGLIAGLVAAAIICKVKGIRISTILDLIAPSIALGQSIGRWGNYFNSEAHGGPTDLPWAIIADGQAVHPTFLYESIWCFLLVLFLLWFDRRRRAKGYHQALAGAAGSSGAAGADTSAASGASATGGSRLGFPGQVFLLYAILYSFERFFVEGLRTDSLMLGPFKQAQVISLTAIVVMAVAYLILSRRVSRQ